jgi:hypothetical protein
MQELPWDLGRLSVVDIVDGEDLPGLSYCFAARAAGRGHEMTHVEWDLRE